LPPPLNNVEDDGVLRYPVALALISNRNADTALLLGINPRSNERSTTMAYEGKIPTLKAERAGLVEQNKSGGWRLTSRGHHLAWGLARYDYTAFSESHEIRAAKKAAARRLLKKCMAGRPGARKAK
jgi:hypothetical protein